MKKPLLFLICLSYLSSCYDPGKRNYRKEELISGEQKLISYTVDGNDSLSYLNKNKFFCSDYYFAFHAGDGDDNGRVKFMCAKWDSLQYQNSYLTTVWAATRKELYIYKTQWQDTIADNFFKPLDKPWYFTDIDKNGFTVEGKENGKKYVARFIKL